MILKQRVALLPPFPSSVYWVLSSLFSIPRDLEYKSLAADPEKLSSALICYLTFCLLLKNERILSPKGCSVFPNSSPLPINLASFYLWPLVATVYYCRFKNKKNTQNHPPTLSKTPLDSDAFFLHFFLNTEHLFPSQSTFKDILHILP